MNVLSYIRVSSKGQVEGDGPERQRLACSRFAEQHGLQMVGEFFEAYTGSSESRPEFARMLAAIAAEPGKVKAVVVERMDRLARDLMASEFLLRDLRKAGVQLFVTDQGQLIDVASNDVDPTRILIRQVLGAMAQWEKASLVKKLRAAQLRAEKEGRFCGRKSYGSKPEEVEGLRQLAEWGRQGYSVPDISDMMNARGYPTRTGVPWSRHTVKDILARYRTVTRSAKAERTELANLLAPAVSGGVTINL